MSTSCVTISLHSYPTRRSSDLLHAGLFRRKSPRKMDRGSATTVAVGDFAIGEEATDEAFAISLKDRKSTRLNSSLLVISYAVFCLKNKIHIYIKCIVDITTDLD